MTPTSSFSSSNRSWLPAAYNLLRVTRPFQVCPHASLALALATRHRVPHQGHSLPLTPSTPFLFSPLLYSTPPSKLLLVPLRSGSEGIPSAQPTLRGVCHFPGVATCGHGQGSASQSDLLGHGSVMASGCPGGGHLWYQNLWILKIDPT